MSKGNESVEMQEFSMVNPTFGLTRETHTRAASPTAQRSNTPNSSSGRFLPRNSWAVLRRNTLLTIAGEVDPITGEVVAPKSIRSAVKHKFNVWCLQGKGNAAVKAFYYFIFSIIVLFYAKERVEEANYKYYLSTAISEAVIVNSENPLLEVTDEDSLWKYLNGPILSLTKSCSNSTSQSCYASISDSVLLIDDFVLTQLRRKPIKRGTAAGTSKCFVPSIMNSKLDATITSCYLDFMESGPDLKLWVNSTVVPDTIAECFALYFEDGNSLKALSERKQEFSPADAPTLNAVQNTWFHLHYGSVGYRVCKLSFLGDNFKENIRMLKQYNYIDRGSTVFILDFTVYSTDMQAVAHVHLVFEFLPSGDIYPNFNIDVFSVSGLSSDGTTESFGLLVLVEIVVAIQFISLLLNIYGAGLGNIRKFCFDAALMYNILCIMTFTSVFAMEHYLVMLRQEAVAETNTIKRNTYIGQISFLENFMTSALAIAVLLTVFRIIQFLKFSKRTSLVIRTIERAFKESGFTLVTVVLVVFSYALAFYIALGNTMKQFRNLRTSFITCLASLFVEIDLIEEILLHSRYLGPVLLITYMFFVSFVVLSLFLAIIEGAFEDIKREAKEEEVDPFVLAIREEAQKQKKNLAAFRSLPQALIKLRSKNGNKNPPPSSP